jgi:GxxExxY protein
LSVLLKKKDYFVEDQKRIDIYFYNEKVGTYAPDKIINNIILLELKCKPFITREDEKQFWHYLKASEYKLGFLINFSPKALEFRRRVYDKARGSKNNK